MIKFDPKYHAYTHDGKKVPSVSTLLNITDSKDFKQWGLDEMEKALVAGEDIVTAKEASARILKESQKKGTHIHSLCEQWNHSGAYDPLIANYIQFMEKNQLTPMLKYCEQPMYTPVWRYAGTADVICTDKDGLYYLVDIKTCRSQIRGHRYPQQLSAYIQLLEDNGIAICKSYILHVNKNEVYEFPREVTDKLFDLFKYNIALYYKREPFIIETYKKNKGNKVDVSFS